MDETDIIILGAGSAGCVLAERLSADPRLRVTLVEAGGTDRRLFVQMPLGYGKLYHDPAVNWNFRAEPDPGLAGQADHWPRGKILGGSSSINAMVWCRGFPEDYDDWAAAGAAGWGWAEVLPSYRALEDWEGGADAFRGAGGPLHVSANTHALHRLTAPFLAACEGAGVPRTADMNGARQDGVGIYQMTLKDGRRNSAARAFLRPAMRRANLRVITRAQATRVVIGDGRATGIAFRRGGEDRVLQARAGVVLAAGAIGSPHLLMLSGVGPGTMLAAQGIPVLRDVPHVGAHLADHLGLNYTWRARVPTLNQRLRPWWGKLMAGLEWLVLGRGPLSTSINQAGGFFRTDPGLPRPNMQLYMQAFSTLIPREGERPVLTPDPFPGMSIGLSNCRPRSRGHLALASPDPMAALAIHPHAYGDAADLDEMLAAVKWLRRIASTPPLADLLAEELRPGPAVQSDDALVADIRARSGTVYHPCGTARMGADPSASVVDPGLAVHGVAGLWVADASVFPNLITGNTNAPAIMVGWRGAGLIAAALR
ncbi:MAG TPA: GMC family oxidoreductase N-terminal domain-containing protein [Paracoccaceae bacterium]|nr:GMC family oxidoreductase N-terminal domain-containing protein [Paracoccaceae bacterium]HMO71753.1 GMC family oxidoreductase N-terminal domain-containing protein [Paracoccaceae bacterium]